MATYCRTCIGELCDHCIWYDFNGGDDGAYLGNGFCRRWKEPRNPDDGCSEYHCRVAKQTGESYATVQKRNQATNKPSGPGAGE